MSLINDALKKAKAAPKPAPVSAPQLRPADEAQPRRVSSPLLVGSVCAVVLTGALLVWYGIKTGNKTEPVVVARAESAQPAPRPTPEITPKPALIAAPGEPPPPTISPTAEPALEVVAEAPTPAADQIGTTEVVTPAEAPKPELPRLQGIFYHPARPTAVLSGKSLSVGGRIGEFRVLAIQPDRVTIAAGDSTNVLSLSE